MWRSVIPTIKPPAAISVAAPIGADEFSALMQSLHVATQHVAVAVSGGPDSMALAFCAQRWGKACGVKISALIVDHALRPESRTEAETVQKRLKEIGITAEILTWDHPPLLTRIHITARKARYRLLIAACKRQTIRHLLLAHQREDQAETVLMRLAKGSGIDGLAGISAKSTMDGAQVLRPLLSVPKERLIATCAAAKLDIVSDPSNTSDKYARGRLRKILPLLAEEGLSIDRLTDLAERSAAARDALDHYTALLVRVATKRDEAGSIRFDLEQLRSAPIAIAERALQICLQEIHAEDYAPERASLLPLLEALCSDDEMAARTLHGCLISKTASYAILLREFSHVTDAQVIHPGMSIVWDNRWRVSLSPQAGKQFTLRALGNPPHDILDRLAPGLRQNISQGRGRASLPALWFGDELAHIPLLEPENATGTNPAQAALIKAWPPI